MLGIFWFWNVISAFFLITRFHSTINIKTYEQAKNKFNSAANAQSSPEESSGKTSYIYWYAFPFHLVQLQILNLCHRWSLKGSEYVSGWHIETWQVEQTVSSWKPSVFIVLPTFPDQSNTKTIPHTVLRHSLITIIDTKLKRFHSGFFELEMPEIFTRAFFIKNHYWNLMLSIVALSSVIKCFP